MYLFCEDGVMANRALNRKRFGSSFRAGDYVRCDLFLMGMSTSTQGPKLKNCALPWAGMLFRFTNPVTWKDRKCIQLTAEKS